MGRFKKGLFLGGLMGAGLMWLNTTKKGKEMRDQIVDQAADVYALVKQKVEQSGALEDLNKNKYVKMVKEAVDKYAVQTGMADDAKKMVMKLVNAQWSQMKRKK